MFSVGSAFDTSGGGKARRRRRRAQCPAILKMDCWLVAEEGGGVDAPRCPPWLHYILHMPLMAGHDHTGVDGTAQAFGSPDDIAECSKRVLPKHAAHAFVDSVGQTMTGG